MADLLRGKAAIVTGAAQGIGRASALRLAAEGAAVLVADRAEPHARRVVEEISAAGGTAASVAVDLETGAGARAMVQAALERFHRIDISVHNVGGTIWMRPFSEYSDAQIEAEISRSLWPTLWCCRAVVPVMLKQRAGAIVNVGSIATRGIYRVPYAAAKGGVHALTAALALELAEHGVRVNCVAPGGVDVGARLIPRNAEPSSEKDQQWRLAVRAQTLRDTPMKRYGLPEELAAAICFLASEQASYITGQVFWVAGGGVG